jgi:hypothetical protein
VFNVIRAIAALALASASAHAAPQLLSTSPWWEKVTVTITGDGKPQACSYQTSRKPGDSKTCEVVGGKDGAGGFGASPTSSKGEYTRLTFERRFHLGAFDAADAKLDPGDTLLGRQVMALAIDSAGAVKDCKIIAASGAMTPDYSCDDAAAEHFVASADTSAAAPRQASMTILVYGHAEHVA